MAFCLFQLKLNTKKENQPKLWIQKTMITTLFKLVCFCLLEHLDRSVHAFHCIYLPMREGMLIKRR